MSLPRRVNANVVGRRLDPVDLLHPQYRARPACANREAFRVAGGFPEILQKRPESAGASLGRLRPEALPGAADHSAEGFSSEGLEDVVHAVGVTGSSRAGIAPQDQDGVRGGRPSDPVEGAPPRRVRPPRVEEQEIRRKALIPYFDVGLPSKKRSQGLSRRGLRCDDDPDLRTRRITHDAHPSSNHYSKACADLPKSAEASRSRRSGLNLPTVE